MESEVFKRRDNEFVVSRKSLWITITGDSLAPKLPDTSKLMMVPLTTGEREELKDGQYCMIQGNAVNTFFLGKLTRQGEWFIVENNSEHLCRKSEDIESLWWWNGHCSIPVY